MRAATRIMKPVKDKSPATISNWWYVVGGFVGLVAVFIFWWFIFPLVVNIFY